MKKLLIFMVVLLILIPYGGYANDDTWTDSYEELSSKNLTEKTIYQESLAPSHDFETIALTADNNISASQFPFDIHVDGNPITLENVFLKDDRTYVQLRELANKMGSDVEWVGFHSAPVPGGNLYDGININQSNVLHTKDIGGWFDGKETYGVEMTSLIKKYNEQRAGELKYYFKDNEETGESGLYITENGEEKFIPITFYQYMGLKYVTADDFRANIQPYYIDICLQN